MRTLIAPRDLRFYPVFLSEWRAGKCDRQSRSRRNAIASKDLRRKEISRSGNWTLDRLTKAW